MIVAIVCLLLVTAICFSLVRIAVAAQQQAERQGWRLQSVWLAESALSQAAARLRRDSNHAGNDWTHEEVRGSSVAGRVRVTVTTPADAGQRRTIVATADFPEDESDRVRTTRTLTLNLPDAHPADTD